MICLLYTSKLLQEDVYDAGHVIYPVLVRYAVRLFDESYVMHSSPLLVGEPNFIRMAAVSYTHLVVEGLSRKTNNPRFAWDSYRRFVQMYGDVVLGMKPTSKEDIDPFEAIIEEVKEAKGVKLDNELDVEDLKALVAKFKMAVKAQTGKDFPTSAYEQLWGAICAVFDSWMNERAILYRKMEGIPAEWGTAVSCLLYTSRCV